MKLTGCTHRLKTWPEPFAAIVAGEKTFELRLDDRGGFNVGDVLQLAEFDPLEVRYTGAEVRRVVSYVLRCEEARAYRVAAWGSKRLGVLGDVSADPLGFGWAILGFVPVPATAATSPVSTYPGDLLTKVRELVFDHKASGVRDPAGLRMNDRTRRRLWKEAGHRETDHDPKLWETFAGAAIVVDDQVADDLVVTMDTAALVAWCCEHGLPLPLE